MGIATRIARFFGRRAHLREQHADAVATLEETALAEVAPDLIEAMASLQKELAAVAYDANSAAHEALTPFREDVRDSVIASVKKVDEQHAKALSEIASRHGDEVKKVREQLEEQREELAGLRKVYAEQQEQARQMQEGLEWTAVKQFCFRFIRILDSMAARIAADADAPAELRDLHDEILFALEASGVEQFAPEARSAFAGNEKTLKVVGKSPTEDPEARGLIAAVRTPGYLLAQEGQPERILRPAQVDVYEVMELEGAVQ